MWDRVIPNNNPLTELGWLSRDLRNYIEDNRTRLANYRGPMTSSRMQALRDEKNFLSNVEKEMANYGGDYLSSLNISEFFHTLINHCKIWVVSLDSNTINLVWSSIPLNIILGIVIKLLKYILIDKLKLDVKYPNLAIYFKWITWIFRIYFCITWIGYIVIIIIPILNPILEDIFIAINFYFMFKDVQKNSINLKSVK